MVEVQEGSDGQLQEGNDGQHDQLFFEGFKSRLALWGPLPRPTFL